MITIRNILLPGDIENLVRYHDEYYAEHYGLNHDFGKYVEGPLAEFYARKSPDEGIWLLEDEYGLKGCIALVRNSEEEAQLRWFYVDESLRGQGSGQRLINLLISFAIEKKYQRIILWTVSLLGEARRMYEKNGFELVEEQAGFLWGRDIVEQKFSRTL
jgi:GNAT superfamily N-acetyltransferase